jgi:hypothetical protein
MNVVQLSKREHVLHFATLFVTMSVKCVHHFIININNEEPNKGAKQIVSSTQIVREDSLCEFVAKHC